MLRRGTKATPLASQLKCPPKTDGTDRRPFSSELSHKAAKVLRTASQEAGRHTDPRPLETLTLGAPSSTPTMPQPGVPLTCWLATIGPASHEALCVHSCCHTHQLQPQRLLTQARHLHIVQSVSHEPETAKGSPELGTGKVRDSRCRWEKLSNCHAVIEGEGGVDDHHSTKPELHSHRDMVCKTRRARTEEWGVLGTHM